MNGWKECKLGDTLGDKGYIRGPFGSSLKRGELSDKGIPVYEQQHAIYNHRNFRFFIDETKYRELKRFTVETNDLIISCSGTLGKVSIINETDPKGIISQALLLFRPDINKILPKYLYYFLSSTIGFNSIISVSSGSVQVNIAKREVIENIKIPLPPLPEQKAIAGVLSSLDDKIDLLHRQNKTLEAVAETIWRKMFIEDADPGWIKGKLGDIADINPLRSIKQGTPAIYVDMANMPTNGPFPTNWIKREFTSGIKFQNGDTNIARITPCLENGKTAYVNFLNDNEIAWGSTKYIIITPKPQFSPEWFYFLARNEDFRDYAIQNMTGTSGRQRVSGETVSKYELSIATQRDFDQFTKISAPIMNHIRHNSFEIRTLSRLRDTLLLKLMSGEVRVNI